MCGGRGCGVCRCEGRGDNHTLSTNSSHKNDYQMLNLMKLIELTAADILFDAGFQSCSGD